MEFDFTHYRDMLELIVRTHDGLLLRFKEHTANVSTGEKARLTQIENILQRVEGKLDLILKGEGDIMNELDDLKAAVSGSQAAIVQMITDTEAAIAKLGTITVPAPGVDPAEVAAQTAAINASTAAMKAESVKLEAALAPPVVAPVDPAPAPVVDPGTAPATN